MLNISLDRPLNFLSKVELRILKNFAKFQNLYSNFNVTFGGIEKIFAAKIFRNQISKYLYIKINKSK
jgi:hypothetical protein